MNGLTKEKVLEVQREAFANASDAFELEPSLGSWRDLETASVAWMRANVMHEEKLVAYLGPFHSSEWLGLLVDPTARHQFTVDGHVAAMDGTKVA